MLKKLRLKIILINMVCVTVVLLCVFFTVCISGWLNAREETLRAARQVLMMTSSNDMVEGFIFDKKHKPEDERSMFIASFCVHMTYDGTITDVVTMNSEVSEELVLNVTELALASEKESGILGGENLRFVKSGNSAEMQIAFVDMSYEIRSVTEMIFPMAAIGLCALFAFFLLSLFLSQLAVKPVEKAWNQQKRFIADASHELKTPLTVILANLGILYTHKSDSIDSNMQWLDNTKVEADRMKKLIEEMLFLAKTDDMRLKPVMTDINFSDLVWNSLLPFEAVAYENNVEIEQDICSDIYCVGDEGQLKRLCVILLDNAFKYAPKGAKVSVCLKKSGEKAIFSVNNTGSVIPAESLERIFERFYRTDKARTRNDGSCGLGLAIAKTIADTHKAKISASSSVSEGTTFTFIFSRQNVKNNG